MSSILSTKKNKEGVVLEVFADYTEYLDLEGHLEDVHLFTEHTGNVKTHISQRGKNGATKYFLVPRQMRKGFKFDNSISCQRIDKEDKVFFIYVVDKMRTSPSRRQIAVSKFAE